MIRLSSVKKAYGTRFMLDIPSLEIEEGRRYALIGANGSGKSTLIRLLAGTLAADEGLVRVPDGLRANMGYMPQNPYAYSFCVQQNVRVACRTRDKREAQRQAKKALELVGLLHIAQAKGNRLSGGETQRMAFARMIVEKRKLLLLDEPTSATDIAGNTIVENALTRYLEENGSTMIFSTHSLAQAERLSDKIIVMHDGKIVEAGEKADVLYHPKSEEARAFLRYWSLEKK